MAGKKKRGTKKRRTKKRNRVIIWICNVLIVVFLCIAAFCAYQIITQLLTQKEGEETYTELQDLAGDETEEVVVEDEEGEETTYTLRTIDFDALKAVNEDVVAWLELEGTIIDYPVVQGTDNTYYLKHLLDGSYHYFGTLFVDYQNSAGFTDANTVIYGHQIKAGDMFHILKYYRDQDYYDEHPYFMLYTPEVTYRLDLFAGCLIDGDDGVPLTFSSDEEFLAYFNAKIAASTFTSDVTITADDRVVTLYTCAYDFDGARYVVYGKLVPLT